MSDEVPDLRDIRREAERLLARAGARGTLPTPVDELVAAAGLVQPKQSMLSEFVLRDAPEHLRRPVRRLRFKIRALLDRKAREVHIDPAIDNPGQVAFKTLHDVAHDILPWQRDLGYADDDATFSPRTRKLFEWQANVGAAELLFQRDLFSDMANEYAIGLASVFDLATQFGSSRRSALHRFAGTHRSPVAAVVLEVSPREPGVLAYRRQEVVLSPAFAERFGLAAAWPRVLHSPPYTFLEAADHTRVSGEVVRQEIVFPNGHNVCQELNVDMFCNFYNLLVLIWVPRRERGRRRRLVVVAARLRTLRASPSCSVGSGGFPRRPGLDIPLETAGVAFSMGDCRPSRQLSRG